MVGQGQQVVDVGARSNAGPGPSDDATRPVVIEVRDISKRFESRDRDVVALQSVSLDVRSGEFLSIVGPSGCGKSTLLNMIAGFIAPSSGEIVRYHEGSTDPRTQVGFVFQDATLLPWRTTLDNTMFMLELLDVPRARRVEIALEKLKLVGLVGFEKRYPHELSGGMRQRVAIARALTYDPPVLLMDEPFGALDAITRERMNVELNRIWRETGKTIVFVTHSISEAVFLSNRIDVMSARPGTIIATFDIPFPHQREPALMGTEEFAALTQEVRSCLRDTDDTAGGVEGLVD